jgi:hypothetical protein
MARLDSIDPQTVGLACRYSLATALSGARAERPDFKLTDYPAATVAFRSRREGLLLFEFEVLRRNARERDRATFHGSRATALL